MRRLQKNDHGTRWKDRNKQRAEGKGLETREMTPQQRVDDALDRILKTSGTALKNYTMQSSIDAMRKEMRDIMVSETSKDQTMLLKQSKKIIEKCLTID